MRNKGLIGQYAGFVTRAIGLILDNMIVIVGVIVINFAISLPLQFFLNVDLNKCPPMVPGGMAFSWALLCHAANILRLVITTVAAPVYFALFWNLGGQTIGQYVVGVRVVRVDGKKMSFLRALVRFAGYLASFLALGLGFLWVLIDDRRQGLPDKMANTVVLYSWEARQNEFLLDKMKRLFKRGKLAQQTPPPPPTPIPAPVLKNLKLILVVFENYESLRKVLNLLQDAIRTGLIKITNVTVLVKDADGEVSILGVSDLAMNSTESSFLDSIEGRLPELEIDQIRDDIPVDTFAVAVVLDEKWANRALRVLHPLGLDVRRYALGASDELMVREAEEVGDSNLAAVPSADGAENAAVTQPSSSAEPPPSSSLPGAVTPDSGAAYAANI